MVVSSEKKVGAAADPARCETMFWGNCAFILHTAIDHFVAWAPFRYSIPQSFLAHTCLTVIKLLRLQGIV